MSRRAALLLLTVALGGCGLRPLYGGADSRAAATLAAVDVAPIPGEAGWLVTTALRDRLSAAGSGTPAYRLEIVLDDDITGLGVRRDDSITRERRTLRARYQLIDLTNGQVLVDATAGSDAGIDVVSSEYATIAAERTALERLSTLIADQIVSRVALYAARTSGAAQP